MMRAMFPERSRVGPFDLADLLGRGGMGSVHRGVSPDGQQVAVKLLSMANLRSGPEIARFERESTIRIDHPNVVRVIDAGVEEDGLPWIAFELLVGEVLSDHLDRVTPSVRRSVAIALDAARGLEAAHAAGVIHRDLKPSNLFLCSDGTLKLIDFGIALLSGGETRLTATGRVLGTPAYLSPEQARGAQTVGPTTDIWSLGAVLYELLVGRCPFERPSPLATMLAVMVEAAPPVQLLAPQVPRTLGDLVARCLEKDPALRFPTATSLATAIAELDVTQLADTPGTKGASAAVADTHLSAPVPPMSITPGEQRLVAVLLADGVRDRLAVEHAVLAAGGTVVHVADGRAIGLFGGEQWEGDEVERAAGAALGARGSARSVAVASGRATYSGVTGISGSALAAAEAGCAARLTGVAVDTTTARAIRHAYTLERVSDTLLEIVERTSAVPHTLAPPAMPHPTLGRETELAHMRTACAVAFGQPSFAAILVVGPPGIGKTHLRWEIDALLEERSGTTVLSGRAEPARRGVAFALWESVLKTRLARGVTRDGWPSAHRSAPMQERLEAVRRLVCEALPGPGEADERLPFFAELLAIAVDSSPGLTAARRDPLLMQDRIRLAIEDWVCALAEAGPVALLLEDLQWADETSLSMLDDLGGILADRPVLAFLTARPELLEMRPQLLAASGPTVLRPRGLSLEQVGLLASRILGHDLRSEAAAALAERTAGNPLFVEQLALAMREEGMSDGDVAGVPLPLTVEAAVQGRLDHLPAQEKELCRRAAIFDGTFTAEDLTALGIAGAPALLASLVQRDLLVPRPRGTRAAAREHGFRSTLVRDVAYAMTSLSLRADLHIRAAQRLSETRADPEQIAHHFDRGGSGDSAGQWYATAAFDAAQRGDAPSVLRCAERALAVGAPPARLFALHMARSDALDVLGRLPEQRATLDEALGCAANDAERARATTDLAVSRWRGGAGDEALHLASEAVRLARATSDGAVLAMARGRQAAVLTYAGRLAEAAEALHEASELRDCDPVTLGPLLAVWRAQLASARGALGERRDAYRDAVDRYEQAGDVRRAAGAQMNLADALNRVGAYAEAEPALRQALERCKRLGNRLMAGYALANLGYALTMLGRPDEALEVLREGSDLALDLCEPRLLLSMRLYGARARCESDPQGAAAEARAISDEAMGLGLEGIAALALSIVAWGELAGGRPAHALEASDRALRLRDELGSVEEDEAEIFLVHARALEASGRAGEARAVRGRGSARVREIAARIGDAEWTRRFLEDVAAHRVLCSSNSGDR